MLEHFILILMVTQGPYVAITSIEFNSKTACDQAGQQFKTIYGKYTDVSYLCTPKGNVHE